METNITYRQATLDDVPAIVDSRGADSEWGPGDPQTALYLQGAHHPQQALAPRVLFVALEDCDVAGYIAGHLTERYGCEGELQYLWVAPQQRRRGAASTLFDLLADWFLDRGAKRICVDVEPGNLAARSFYASRGAVDLNSHWLVWDDISSES